MRTTSAVARPTVAKRPRGREGRAGRGRDFRLGRHEKMPGLRRDDQGDRAACRYCDTDFDTVDPLSLRDLHSGRGEDGLQTTRTAVTTLFVLSILLGCPAPILAIVAPIYVIAKRATIAKAGPAYLVMGYSAIGISVLYSILIGGFLLSRDEGPATKAVSGACRMAASIGTCPREVATGPEGEGPLARRSGGR